MALIGRAVTMLAIGFLLLGIATIAAFTAVLAFARPADLDELPLCERDFDDGCRTEREVLLTGTQVRAGDWFIGTATWEVRVNDDQPDGTRHGVATVSIRRQAHDDELRAGAGATAIYTGPDLLWLRTPSGAYVQTADHPRYAGPFGAGLALMFGGAGGWVIGLAITAARERGSWTDVGPPVVRFNVGMAVAGIGLAALVAAHAYPRPAPIVVIAPAGAALIGILILRRRRRTGRGEPDPADLPDELVRLISADPVPPGARRNVHLYLVARPDAEAGRLDAPHPARLAARVERLLAAQDAAAFWPGLGRLLWAAEGDGVRLTHGVLAGRVDEDDLLVVTVAANGTVTLLCGRGTTRPWLPERRGAEPAGAVDAIVDPALVLGLTRVVLHLAAECGRDATANWTVAMDLGGAQVVHASGQQLAERTDALAGRLAGPLLGGFDPQPS